MPRYDGKLFASPYEWLGEEKLTLHGAIDDATGNILGLYLTREECLQGYFEVVRTMVRGYGIYYYLYIATSIPYSLVLKR